MLTTRMLNLQRKEIVPHEALKHPIGATRDEKGGVRESPDDTEPTTIPIPVGLVGLVVTLRAHPHKLVDDSGKSVF
jgi:hypothetical protein